MNFNNHEEYKNWLMDCIVHDLELLSFHSKMGDFIIFVKGDDHKILYSMANKDEVGTYDLYEAKYNYSGRKGMTICYTQSLESWAIVRFINMKDRLCSEGYKIVAETY